MATNPPINVKWFGAKGDGVTDDTVAINAALAGAAPSGTLHFPIGRYIVTSTITLLGGLQIEGEGTLNSTQQTANIGTQLAWGGAAGGTVVLIGGLPTTTRTQGLTVKNLSVSGSGTASYGIQIGTTFGNGSAAGCKLENVWARGCTIAGIRAMSAEDFDFINCNASYNTAAGAIGLLFDDTGANTICRVIGGDYNSNTGAGIHVRYLDSGLFLGNVIQANTGGGIVLQPSSAASRNIRDLNFINTWLELNGSAGSPQQLLCDSDDTGIAHRVMFDKVYFRDVAAGVTNQANLENIKCSFNQCACDGANNTAFRLGTDGRVVVYETDDNGSSVLPVFTLAAGDARLNRITAAHDNLVTFNHDLYIEGNHYVKNFAGTKVTWFEPAVSANTQQYIRPDGSQFVVVNNTTGSFRVTLLPFSNDTEQLGNSASRWKQLNLGTGGLRVLETGSNKRLGSTVLVAGTSGAIANTSVQATTRIFLSRSTTGGTPGDLSSTRVNGTSFTINSTNGADTSTIDWLLVEAE